MGQGGRGGGRRAGRVEEFGLKGQRGGGHKE